MRKTIAFAFRENLTDEMFVPHLFYRRSVASKIFVSAVKGLVRAFLGIFFQLKVKGSEHIPDSGPYLVCPNHLSDVDPLLLYSLLPEDTLYVAYEANFRRPPLSWIVSFGRVLLTTRGGKVPRCLVRAYHGLQDSLSVCLFPEGGRTTTGTLMEPRDGAAILSIQANVPIIPVLIEGSQSMLSRIRPGFRFCKIRVTFGKPLRPQGKTCSELLKEWTEAINDLTLRASRPRYWRSDHDFPIRKMESSF